MWNSTRGNKIVTRDKQIQNIIFVKHSLLLRRCCFSVVYLTAYKTNIILQKRNFNEISILPRAWTLLAWLDLSAPARSPATWPPTFFFCPSPPQASSYIPLITPRRSSRYHSVAKLIPYLHKIFII